MVLPGISIQAFQSILKKGVIKLKEPIERVTIAPCMGIGQTVAGVTRLAAYIVNEELLPDQTILLCVPALIAGVIEDIDMAEVYPTIVIDGCSEKCGSQICHFCGIKPAARIYVPEIIHETRLSPGHTRQELEESGKKLARVVAERVAIIAKGILNDPDYDFKVQKINTHGHTHDPEIEKTLEYGCYDGFYKPKSMPEINLKEGDKCVAKVLCR
jgi:uncharacterized metal-binding protein